MRGLPEDPARLRDQRDQPNLVERIAGQAARDLAEPAQLPSATMARIAARIDAGRTKNPRSLRLGWVLVIGVLLLGIVTAASAARLDLVPRWLTRIVQGKPKPASPLTVASLARPRPVTGREQPILPATAATPDESNEAPAENPLPESTPMPAPVEHLRVAADRGAEEAAKQEAKPAPRKPLGGGPRKAPSAAMLGDEPGTPSAPTGYQPLSFSTETAGSLAPSAQIAHVPQDAVELPPPSTAPGPPEQATPPPASPRQRVPAPTRQSARYLREIVQALRVDHAPNQALALLDRHASELTGQAFAEESMLLRVEAMLDLGQRSAVLRLLDVTSLSDVAASRALLVTRGELRAAANRCAEGVGDFDLVLAEARRPPKQALLGRAHCKQRLGDTAGAKADLDRYQREFPDDPLP